MAKWKRIIVTLAIAVVVGGIYLWFFGVQTMCALTVRYSYRNMPDVVKVPVALSDLSISNVPHRRVSYFGYEFELPWDDVDDQKDKTVAQIHVSVFHSGNAFWFSTFPPKNLVNEVMKTAALEPQGFRQLYGKEASESDYSFESELLHITPREITPFVSRRQAVAGEMLLLIKAISMPKADSGIFAIRIPGFQGFQFENPESRPPRITDELYSNNGGIDIMFLQKADGSAPSISQAEINRVIQSIHKAPASAVALNGNEQK